MSLTTYAPKHPSAFSISDENVKRILNENYTSHHKEKELCRKEKVIDKQYGNVAVYDLQSALQLLKGLTLSFCYKSKINCWNLTVNDFKAKHGLKLKKNEDRMKLEYVFYYIQKIVQESNITKDLK